MDPGLPSLRKSVAWAETSCLTSTQFFDQNAPVSMLGKKLVSVPLAKLVLPQRQPRLATPGPGTAMLSIAQQRAEQLSAISNNFLAQDGSSVRAPLRSLGQAGLRLPFLSFGAALKQQSDTPPLRRAPPTEPAPSGFFPSALRVAKQGSALRSADPVLRAGGDADASAPAAGSDDMVVEPAVPAAVAASVSAPPHARAAPRVALVLPFAISPSSTSHSPPPAPAILPDVPELMMTCGDEGMGEEQGPAPVPEPPPDPAPQATGRGGRSGEGRKRSRAASAPARVVVPDGGGRTGKSREKAAVGPSGVGQGVEGTSHEAPVVVLLQPAGSAAPSPAVLSPPPASAAPEEERSSPPGPTSLGVQAALPVEEGVQTTPTLWLENRVVRTRGEEAEDAPMDLSAPPDPAPAPFLAASSSPAPAAAPVPALLAFAPDPASIPAPAPAPAPEEVPASLPAPPLAAPPLWGGFSPWGMAWPPMGGMWGMPWGYGPPWAYGTGQQFGPGPYGGAHPFTFGPAPPFPAAAPPASPAAPPAPLAPAEVHVHHHYHEESGAQESGGIARMQASVRARPPIPAPSLMRLQPPATEAEAQMEADDATTAEDELKPPSELEHEEDVDEEAGKELRVGCEQEEQMATAEGVECEVGCDLDLGTLDIQGGLRVSACWLDDVSDSSTSREDAFLRARTAAALSSTHGPLDSDAAAVLAPFAFALAGVRDGLGPGAWRDPEITRASRAEAEAEKPGRVLWLSACMPGQEGNSRPKPFRFVHPSAEDGAKRRRGGRGVSVLLQLRAPVEPDSGARKGCTTQSM
jgi:hypothetical protein